MNTCKKRNNKTGNYNLLYKLVTQYLKTILTIGCIFLLIFIRKGITNDLTIGKIIAYILLAGLFLVIIFLADNFAYNNIIIGIGIYFGFELLKFV